MNLYLFCDTCVFVFDLNETKPRHPGPEDVPDIAGPTGKSDSEMREAIGDKNLIY